MSVEQDIRAHAGGRNRPARTVAVLLAGSVTALLAVAPASADGDRHGDGRTERAPRCLGQRATVVGTDKTDTLRGTPGRDVVVARDGHDSIRTGRGPDLVCAGDGFDHVALGGGRDRARGGDGDDTLVGSAGRDELLGQKDVDSLVGGGGDDELVGGRGTGLVVEALIGGPGDDRLVGGRGRDTAQYFDSKDGVVVDLRKGQATGDGRDRLSGIEGVVGSNAADLLIGDDGGNGLFGQGGNDRIVAGGSGFTPGTEDVLSGDQGDDTLLGGRGGDVAAYLRLLRPVHVRLRAGVAVGQGGDRLSGVDSLWGSRLDDRLAGDRDDNTLLGFDGDDSLAGFGGTDVLDGGSGADTCSDPVDPGISCEFSGAAGSRGPGQWSSPWLGVTTP